jgi:hypothetical protein
MKKNTNLFSDDFNEFHPKKVKIKNTKSKQISFSELDYDSNYQSKRKKTNHVDYSGY